jgi:NADH:ubiquinone oxidoreductase subunit 5 (subunit L)/multisubunit Na+/H+ antiporter MnhA subunit
MSPLTTTIIGLPLLASALVAMASRRIHRSAAHRVTLGAIGLTALFVLALLLPDVFHLHSGGGSSVTVEWLPGSGPMGLTTGTSSVYAVLVTTWAGFLAFLGTASRGVEFRPLSGAVTLLALASANIAFLADHFLARYVALEAVALCVALAPLVEVRDPASTRLAWSTYLLLRIGDAGLLLAILILGDIVGTLSIDPALGSVLSSMERAGSELDAVRLGWMVAGFVLAVWVKLGGWPFHLWTQTGRRLSLASQAWLYAAVVPNLGAYLLYRVTPLLALAGPLQMAALWLGAGAAALATLIALTQSDVRAALVYVGAAQGGLALFTAATGNKPVVWVGLLVLTPLRLLLFLASDVSRNSNSATLRMSAIRLRRVAACLFALGGLALAAFDLLMTWWAREAGAPLDALFIAEAAVALTAVWTARTAWLLSDVRHPHRPLPGTGDEIAVHWTQGIVVGLLGGGALACGLTFGPLLRYLIAASHMTLPTLPTFPALLRYAATAPALLAVLVLSLAAWRLQRRSKQEPSGVVEPAEEVYDLEEGLARAAQVLHSVVEVGIAEQIITLVVRTVVQGARAAWAVEHRGLEGITSRSAQAVVNGAHTARRIVEQEGLEGVLRRAVRMITTLSRIFQRWHTGRLRRNLLWVPITLVLAVLALAVYGW